MSIKYKAMSNEKYAIRGGCFGFVLSVVVLITVPSNLIIPTLLFFAPLYLLYSRFDVLTGKTQTLVAFLSGVLLYIGYAILLGWGNRRNKGGKILLFLVLFHFGAVVLSVLDLPGYWDYKNLKKIFRVYPFVTVMIFSPFVLALFVSVYTALKTRTIEDGIPFCGKCHYNLTGNTSGVCPECGEEIKYNLGKSKL